MLTKLLQAKRMRYGLSFRDAAAESGLSLNTYWRAEQGRGVSGGTLGKLADWLDVPPAALTDASYSTSIELDISDIAALDAASALIERTIELFGSAPPVTLNLSLIRQRAVAP